MTCVPCAGCRTVRAPRADRDAERLAGRDDLAVDLPRQVGVRADLDAAAPGTARSARSRRGSGPAPARPPGPSPRCRRRQDAHVEQPVVEPGPGQQGEPAGQQPGVGHHHAPRPPVQRLGVVQPDGEIMRRPPTAGSGPARRVGGPAEPPLEPLAGPPPPPRRPGRSRPSRRTRSRPRPGPVRVHVRRPSPVASPSRSRPPVTSARSIRRSRPPNPASTASPARPAQRPRGQVRGAQRHDRQRHARARQRLGAGPDGAVTAGREHQARPGGHRAAG